MSVTFWCPDAPRTEVVPYPEIDPDFVDHVSELPEINVSNTNARALIEMIGLPSSDDLVGAIEPADLPVWIERLRRVLKVGAERAAFLEPTTVNGHVVLTGEAQLARSMGTMAVEQFSPRLAVAMAHGCDDEAADRAATLDALLPTGADAQRAYADGKRGRPRIIEGGRDDRYLREQAARFLDLFTQAKERNFAVCWG